MIIYFGSTFVVMVLLPFPIDWAVAISSDFRSIKDSFKSISSSTSDSTLYGYQRISYYCMSCGRTQENSSSQMWLKDEMNR
jgi:hypothetical protein